jgi:hypothetical protein
MLDFVISQANANYFGIKRILLNIFDDRWLLLYTGRGLLDGGSGVNSTNIKKTIGSRVMIGVDELDAVPISEFALNTLP